MLKSNLLSTTAVIITALVIATSALQAGTPAGAAPAPLAGGGLLYLAVGGSAAGAWLSVKALAKWFQTRNKNPD